MTSYATREHYLHHALMRIISASQRRDHLTTRTIAREALRVLIVGETHCETYQDVQEYESDVDAHVGRGKEGLERPCLVEDRRRKGIAEGDHRMPTDCKNRTGGDEGN